MCFDIYWAFSGIRNLKGSAKERELKKFLLYALYAWGCPLILLVFTLIMDYSSILPASSPYKPDMGLKNCFFETSEATWLYFYGPMTVLIFANLVMFAITARRIFVHRRETSVLKSGDSKRHNNDKESFRFNLYLKLFVVMGINWVMELVSWVVKGPQQIWYLTDITNTLQGVFIFVIFVCKRRIFRLINQKLCPGKKLWPGHSTKSSHGASTTSHATGSTVASSGSGKKQGVSTINMEPMSEDSVRLNAEDSDGQM
ncbi:hypothetical protein AAG570_010420 [Ranatra chinensis]|uniref:G-protein coupled receptors family 2 profile 2 domain-containing protein n=1 Tax=Ranatra chinensis TaxID=642074 RepID=A0ABD0YMJ0_9HEMI